MAIRTGFDWAKMEAKINTMKNGSRFPDRPKLDESEFYPCRLAGVNDLGLVDVTFEGQTKQKHKLNLTWCVYDADNSVYVLVSEKLTISSHEKSGMFKRLKGWGKEGQKITDLIGHDGVISVTYREWEGKTFANITTVKAASAKRPFVEPTEKLGVPNWIVTNEGIGLAFAWDDSVFNHQTMRTEDGLSTRVTNEADLDDDSFMSRLRKQ